MQGHGIQGCSSCNITFYTTLLSLSRVARTLNTVTLNSAHNVSVPAKQAALTAVIDQLVVDACNLVSEGVCMCMCWYMWQLYNHAVQWVVLLNIFEVIYYKL